MASEVNENQMGVPAILKKENLDKPRIGKKAHPVPGIYYCSYLLARHHNSGFQSHMDTYLPNWRHLKKELNKFPVSHADWNY